MGQHQPSYQWINESIPDQFTTQPITLVHNKAARTVIGYQMCIIALNRTATKDRMCIITSTTTTNKDRMYTITLIRRETKDRMCIIPSSP
jgi:hypothetical protein